MKVYTRATIATIGMHVATATIDTQFTKISKTSNATVDQRLWLLFVPIWISRKYFAHYVIFSTPIYCSCFK
jgi:hypothetical protein